MSTPPRKVADIRWRCRACGRWVPAELYWRGAYAQVSVGPHWLSWWRPRTCQGARRTVTITARGAQ